MDVFDFTDVHKHILFFCVCLIIVLLFLILSNALTSNAALEKVHGKLANLVRQALALHRQANQSTDPSLILQHATEGLAYLTIARKLAQEDTLMQSTDVNVIQLEKELLDLQIAAAANTKSLATSMHKF